MKNSITKGLQCSDPTNWRLKLRLSLILLFISLFHMEASTYSQNTKITLDAESVSVESVLKMIESQSEFKFFCNVNMVDIDRIVTIKMSKQRVFKVLKVLFNDTNTIYTIVDRQIILTNELHKNDEVTSLALKKAILIQQEIEIVGTVKDSDGIPLPDASIIIKGTSIGVVTDFDGNFKISVPNTSSTLVISYIGMTTQEVTVGNQTTIDIVLVTSAENIDEVIVTALGMKREKRALGYSVGEINDEVLNVVPQENALSGMSGKVSGLDIRRAGGDLNGETHVYIRGRTSLSGNDEPLVIVDGTPVGNPNVMSDISSVNIKSVSVLKGASAAALYGSRAGNGVIIISTKSGQGSKKGIGVSINSSVTFNKPYKYFELQNRFTNGKSHGLFDEGQRQYWWGAEEGTMAVQWNTNGEEKPLVFYDNSLEDYFQTGFSTINDVSVTGAYDKGSFRLAVSQMSGSGFSPGTDLQKIGFNLATSYKITDKFTISSNIDISNPNSNNSPFQFINRDDQYYDIFNIAPHININDLKGDLWEVENIMQRKIYSDSNNPWWYAKYVRYPYDRIRGFGNIKLDWDILPNLKAMARVAHNSTNTKNEVIKPWSYSGFTTSKPHGSYFVKNTNQRETNIDFLLSYDKKIGDFRTSASFGGNIMNRYTSVINSGGDNIVLPGLFTLSNVERGGLVYESGVYEKAIYSLYGVANLSYKNMIYLDLTARNDWSSTLPEENRSYFYPSASLSLLISEMIEMPSWVSLIKIRSGWAQVGKDTDPYLINPSLTQGTWGSDFTYSLPSSMPNPNLKPEIATSYEIGTDLSFFHGRLGFEATYYKTQNKNQILNVVVSPMTGYTSTTINAGNVENSGIELGFNAIPVKFEDFEWSLNVNFTKASSQLVDLTEGIDRVSFGGGSGMYAYTKVGGYIGDLYSYGIKKVEEGPYKGWNLLDKNGRLAIEKNIDKMPHVGNFTNDFFMGLNTSVSYKAFTLSASFDWRQGGDYFSESMKRSARSGKIEKWERSNGQTTSTFQGVLGANDYNGLSDELANEIRNNPKYRDYDVWVGGRNEELGGFFYDGYYTGAFYPGVIDNGDGTYTENFGAEGTRMFDAYRTFKSSGSFWRTGYAYMFDASFIKMRDITLSYQLPENIVGAIKAQGISVSVFAKNIMLWTKADNGIDPENAYRDSGQDQGFERWSMAPWSVPIGFRLNINF